MEDKVKTWLFDIRRAIEEINSLLPEKKNFLEFKKDLKTKRAVERNIEIIGEAVNRIAGVAPDIEISNSRKIIATRNRIIHGYDSVSIIVNNLPELKTEIDKLLN